MSLYAVPMSVKEAMRFVGQYHRHSRAPNGGLFAVGVSDGTQLWGVAITARPVARMLARDGYTAEVTRVCVQDGAPLGACSFLYGACWRAARALGYTRLVTYTLVSESGASLRGAGWTVISETKPETWDRPSRAREWQPIYGQAKFRWEVTAPPPRVETLALDFEAGAT